MVGHGSGRGRGHVLVDGNHGGGNGRVGWKRTDGRGGWGYLGGGHEVSGVRVEGVL